MVDNASAMDWGGIPHWATWAVTNAAAPASFEVPKLGKCWVIDHERTLENRSFDGGGLVSHLTERHTWIVLTTRGELHKMTRESGTNEYDRAPWAGPDPEKVSVAPLTPDDALRMDLRLESGTARSANTFYNWTDRRGSRIADNPGDGIRAGLRAISVLSPSDGLAARIASRKRGRSRGSADAEPGTFEDHLDLADDDMAEDRADAAFDRLVWLVRTSAGPQREAARERLVGFFSLLGQDDSRVHRARQALASALN